MRCKYGFYILDFYLSIEMLWTVELEHKISSEKIRTRNHSSYKKSQILFNYHYRKSNLKWSCRTLQVQLIYALQTSMDVIYALFQM